MFGLKEKGKGCVEGIENGWCQTYLFGKLEQKGKGENSQISIRPKVD